MKSNLKINNIAIGVFVFMAVIVFGGHSKLLSVLLSGQQAAEVVPGTGYIVYGTSNTEISQILFTTTGNQGAVLSTTASVTVGTLNPPVWVHTAASPVKKEAFMGNLNTSGTLEMLSWTGTNWLLNWTENRVGSAALDTRAYDIEFERKSGEAIAVWAKQKGTTGATVANDIEYKVWDGSSWGASTSFSNTITIASISWIDLWSHPASGSDQNDIVMCYATGDRPALTTDGTMVGCAVWDGTNNTWGDQVLVESNAEEESILGDSHTYSGFHEQGSGDFVVVAGIEGLGSVAYTTWNGSSWVATQSKTFTTAIGLDSSSIINCNPMPWISGVANNQAICVINSASTDDSNVFDWNGSTFGTVTTVDTATSTTSNKSRIGVDSAWLINGTNRVGLGAITDAAATPLKNHRWDEGAGTWAASTTSSNSVEIHDHVRWVQNPDQKNKAAGFIVDGGEDLHFYVASISGSTTPAYRLPRMRVTSNTSTTTDGLSADIFYLNYASPTQSHYRWYNDDAALGSATTISAEDVPASGSEDLTIDTTYRLRFQVSNEGPGSAGFDKYRLEMVRKGSTCSAPSSGWSWTPVPATATVASHAFDIEASTHFANNASTSAALLTASDPTYANGYALDTTATTGFQFLSGNNYSEFEFAVKPNSNANTSADYCFRLRRLNAGPTSTPATAGTIPASISYSVYAEAGVQAAASVTLAQNDYGWFVNDNSVQPGAALAAENTQVERLYTQNSTPVRLRQTVNVPTGTASANSLSFNLQYAKSTSGPWTAVGEPSASTVKVHVGGTDWLTSDVATTTTAVSTTDKDGAGFDPSVVFYMLMPRSGTTDGTTRESRDALGFGVATSTTSRRSVGSLNTESATSATGRIHRSDAVVAFDDHAGGIGGLLDIDQFGGGTNGFRYIVDQAINEEAPANNVRVMHFAIGGDAVTNVAQGEFTEPSTATTLDVTGLGFNPSDGDLLVIFTAGATGASPTVQDANTALNIGMATSASDEKSFAYFYEDNSATADIGTYGRSDKLITLMGDGLAVSIDAVFDSWIADGFRISFNTVTGSANTRFFYAVVKGPTFKLFEDTTETSVTTYSQSGFGFAPRGGMIFGSGNAEEADGTGTASETANAAVFSGPASHPAAPISQRMRSFRANSQTRIWAGGQEDAVLMEHFENTVNAVAEISSVDADGITFNQSNADDANRWFYGLAIGDGSEASEDSEWGFYNNAAATDGAAINTNLIGVSDVVGRYAESNPTTATHNSVSAGQDIEYDFSLDPTNVDFDATYYFRLVTSADVALDTYNDYPSIVFRSPATYNPPAEATSGGGTIRTGGGAGGSGGGSEGGGSGGGGSQGGGGEGGGGGGSPILWQFLKWLSQHF